MEEIVVCESCGESISTEEAIEINGKYYCKNCIEDMLNDGEIYICKRCGKYVFEDNVRIVDEDPYCDNCFYNVDAYLCDFCGEYHYCGTGEIWLEDAEEYMCADCQDRYDYYCCEHCGRYFRHCDDGTWDDDDWYCEDCVSEGYGPSRVIQEYHSMQYRALTFHPYDRRELHMGVEIEMDGAYSDAEEIANDAIDIFNHGDDFMNPEHDGSVDVEIITEPATLDYFESLRPKFDKFFDRVNHYGFNYGVDTNAGGHIHVDKKWFDYDESHDWALTINKLAYVFYRYYYELLAFAHRRYPRRYGCSHEYYMRYKDLPSDIGESYVDECRCSYTRDRYYALNLTNENTIEFRIFGAYHSTEQLFAYLKFSKRLCELALNKTMAEFKEMTFEELLGDDPEIRHIWNLEKHRFFDFIRDNTDAISEDEYAEYAKEFPEEFNIAEREAI